MNDEIKKELKGRMWPEPDSTVVHKGPVHIGGIDKYMTILKTKVQNEYKYECVQSVGLLYLKDDQSKPKAPDIGGPITLHDYHGGAMRKILEGLIKDLFADDESYGRYTQTGDHQLGSKEKVLLAKYNKLIEMSKGQIFKFGGWSDHNQETGKTTLSIGLLVSDKVPEGANVAAAGDSFTANAASQDPDGSDSFDDDIPF